MALRTRRVRTPPAPSSAREPRDARPHRGTRERRTAARSQTTEAARRAETRTRKRHTDKQCTTRVGPVQVVGQLRKTHWQGHPDEFWTSGPSAHAATFRPGSRQCTPRGSHVRLGAAVPEREALFASKWPVPRSATPAGCDPYARRAAQNDGRRRGAASTAGFKAPEFRNRPKSASAMRRKKGGNEGGREYYQKAVVRG